MSSYAVKLGDTGQQVAICIAGNGNVIAAYRVPGSDTDAKDAVTSLESGLGFQGEWIIIPLGDVVKQGRGSSKKVTS